MAATKQDVLRNKCYSFNAKFSSPGIKEVKYTSLSQTDKRNKIPSVFELISLSVGHIIIIQQILHSAEVFYFTLRLQYI